MRYLLLLALLPVLLSAAEPAPAPALVAEDSLKEVAKSDAQWTGVAVSKSGRIFVNYPRWSDSVPISVAEIGADGTPKPFPNAEWNRWEAGLKPSEHFVCVQSVVVDAADNLWILDPANPQFKGVVAGGPKLLKVDLKTNTIVQSIAFDPTVAPAQSYLNDVRVDTQANVAYITDSGAGALVVVDLAAGKAQRRLAAHPSTKAEKTDVVIDGKPWRMGGNKLEVHSDGIALDSRGEYLYYQALTGRTLYRVPTAALRDPNLSEEELGKKVEKLGETGIADGLECDAQDRIYITALEESAIKRRLPNGTVETVVRSPLLAWPDSLAWGADGSLYIATSQIHLGPKPATPYRVFKLPPLK